MFKESVQEYLLILIVIFALTFITPIIMWGGMTTAFHLFPIPNSNNCTTKQ